MHGDKVNNGSDGDTEKKEGLSFIQFLLIGTMASGAPYGVGMYTVFILSRVGSVCGNVWMFVGVRIYG